MKIFAGLMLAAICAAGTGMRACAPDFASSENVFFLPHVGKDYGGGQGGIFGKRVCVVGASHYARGYEDCLRGNGRDVWRMMTRNAVRDYLDPNFRAETSWKSTYTKFINTFFDAPTGTRENFLRRSRRLRKFYGRMRVSRIQFYFHSANFAVPKALKLRERVPTMANPHKSERILFQLFSNSVIVIVIVIVARMRVSRVGVK